MAINVYEPLKFSTQGINDLATQPSLTVTNGTITVNTVQPKTVSFLGASLAEVEGNGLQWTDGRKNKSLLLRQGNLWSDLNVNLAEEQEYYINDTSVLSFTSLGPTVTNSNLKIVGTLKNLNVAGNSALGYFVFINSDTNKVGIGTESPALGLGISENHVDLALGSNKTDVATFGTISNDHLEIVTDNTTRITVRNNGEVQVHGKFIVEDLVIEKSSTLVYRETADSTNYGNGILWANTTRSSAQFIYHAEPDRIWSTESIDLISGKYFAINNKSVLSQDTLGDSVVNSSLTKVGVLKDLQVAGDAAISRTLHTNRVSVGSLILEEQDLEIVESFDIVRDHQSEFNISDTITIGNSSNISRAVSLYGQVTVGVANPDPGVALTVAGPVSIENKKFQVGDSIPTSGSYSKGDIVWNANPMPHNFIGWVCIVSGTPGQWLPFGAIAAQ
jgi:hypothetical protein